MNETMDRRRPVGRLKTSWRDVPERDMDGRRLSVEEVKLEARDREK